MDLQEINPEYLMSQGYIYCGCGCGMYALPYNHDIDRPTTYQFRNGHPPVMGYMLDGYFVSILDWLMDPRVRAASNKRALDNA